MPYRVPTTFGAGRLLPAHRSLTNSTPWRSRTARLRPEYAHRPQTQAYADTEATGLHLAEVGRAVAPGAHAVVVLDRAGWHGAGDLAVPGNLTLLPLPSYSPELNPVENVWEYLRQNKLSHRVWESYDAIVATCCEAWNWLVAAPDRLASITRREWAKAVTN